MNFKLKYLAWIQIGVYLKHLLRGPVCHMLGPLTTNTHFTLARNISKFWVEFLCSNFFCGGRLKNCVLLLPSFGEYLTPKLHKVMINNFYWVLVTSLVCIRTGLLGIRLQIRIFGPSLHLFL